jgi:hypothetical protein
MAYAIKAEVVDPRAESFAFYRPATNKIVGISAATAAFLDGFF